ncbi:MAG TPA: T9SS type A sorting domain-containing protein [Candidatus Cloacimonadota bacterium]|nr:T9SS type A sorting domain-containing protein [Candidatus Cloacimonadota bacterium]HPT73163.1 T9SS type A sorting domain-containing protein [Candidatus Cloacimonadota bacterium]
MRIGTVILFLLLPFILLAQLAPSFHSGMNTRDARAWRLDSVVSSNWNGTSFVPSDKQQFTYYCDSLYAVQQIDGYHYLDSTWSPASLMSFTYDPTHHYLSQVQYFTYVNQYTIPSKNYTFTYDDQKHLTETDTYLFHPSASNWSLTNRLHLIYDNDSLSQSVEWIYSGGSYTYNRYDFEYGTDGKLADRLGYAGADSSSWTANARDYYTYHADDASNAAGFISFMAHDFPYLLSLQQDTSYGMISEFDHYYYSCSWIYSSRITRQYDSSDRLTDCLTEMNTAGWVNDSKFTITYDENGNPSCKTTYDWNNGNWVPVTCETYTFSTFTMNQDPVALPSNRLNMNIFPSPFSKLFSVYVNSKTNNEASIGIYNIRGQCVKSEKILPNRISSLDTSNLPSGMYFIKASQGSNTQTKKVIKIK